MKRTRSTLLMLLLFGCIHSCILRAQDRLPDSIREHLDTTLLFMQRSLYAADMNWAELSTRLYADAAAAVTKQETFPAMQRLFTSLHDHHGFLAQGDLQARLPDTAQPARLSANIRKEWAKGWKIRCGMIGGFAYLRIPGIFAFSTQEMKRYADMLLDSVIMLAERQPRGWVIDLRMNTGGHIVPMMSALAGFFPDGPVSTYVNAAGEVQGRTRITEGIFRDDTVSIRMHHAVPDLRRARVAVLLGPGTASSGEGLAYDLLQRKRTRSFGEPTAGYANSTEGFRWNGDESYLLLTTSYLGTASGRPQPVRLLPMVAVESNDLFEHPELDTVTMAAIRWLDH